MQLADVADDAGAQRLDRPARALVRVPLRAHLRDDSGLARDARHLARFEDAVGQRLLAIDVLAPPHGRDGDNRVVVIGRRHEDRVEVPLAIQEPPPVAESCGVRESPPLTMTWYDGGKLPPAELFHGEKLITRDGGSLVVGSKGTLFTRTWHGGQNDKDMFLLLPRKQFEGIATPAATLPRTASHHQEWVDACRGQGKTLSEFGYAASLTETLLVGNLALRTGKAIEWDSGAMRATNSPDADRFIRPEFRAGWTL